MATCVTCGRKATGAGAKAKSGPYCQRCYAYAKTKIPAVMMDFRW